MRELSPKAVAAFWSEIEKIAAHEKAKRYATGGAVAAGGAALTYGAGRLAMRSGKKLSPRVVAALAALTGLTGSRLIYALKDYANEPAKPGSELGDLAAVQPKDGGLAQRHQGHPAPVPAGRVPPDAAGGVPLRAGSRGGNGREEHRADHFRSGSSEYKFSGKTPRTYHFTRTVRLGE